MKDGELIWITKFSPSARVRLPALAWMHKDGATCDILQEYWVVDEVEKFEPHHPRNWPLDDGDRWHLADVDGLDDKTLAILMKWTLTHG